MVVTDVHSLSRRLREASLVFLLAMTLNLAGNARIGLFDRDEPRYASCAREMRDRGEWLRPTFNGEPRYHKPILIYWLMRAGMALGGDNPFGARLVSAVAGSATCVLVWGMGRSLWGSKGGLLAALILATSPIMVIESKMATTDAVLTFWLTSGQYCLWELSKRPSRLLAGLFWAAMGMAMLTKGPVGLAIIALAGIVSWWWGGPTDCWRRLHWKWGFAGFLAITAPWYLAIGLLSHGEFYRFMMGTQGIGRIATGIEEHSGFPGYYPVTSLLAFYPWSAVLPAAVLALWSRRKEQGRLEYGFLLGWIIGPLFMLELVRTKLIHYYLPSLPACRALAASWLIQTVAADVVNLRRWPLGRLAVGVLGGVGIGMAVCLIAGVVVLPSPLKWPCLALAVLLTVGTLYALDRLHNGATERAAFALVGAWALILWGWGVWLLPAAQPFLISKIAAERLKGVMEREDAEPMLATYQQGSVIYRLGRPVAILRNREALTKTLRAGKSVVSLLNPTELARLSGDPRFEVEMREVVEGFNLDKGRKERLQLVLIRLREPQLAGRDAAPAK